MTYPLTTNQRTYTLVDDLTDIFQVVMTGRVLSAEWNTPLSAFQIDVDRPDIFVNLFPTGYFALAGKIAQLFPELDTQAYVLQITLNAPGHESASAAVAIPIGSTFPLAEQLFSLNYSPVRIQGRVTLVSSAAPVINASVTVAEANLATLRAPTRFAHSNGTQVNSGALNASGALRTVIESALPDAQRTQAERYNRIRHRFDPAPGQPRCVPVCGDRQRAGAGRGAFARHPLSYREIRGKPRGS